MWYRHVTLVCDCMSMGTAFQQVKMDKNPSVVYCMYSDRIKEEKKSKKNCVALTRSISLSAMFNTTVL